MKSGHGSCSWKRTRWGPTTVTSFTFSRRILEPLARWKLNFTSSAVNGIAVVELHALPQLELVDALVRAHRPRLGQAGRHEVAGHGLDERVVQRIEHPERRDDTGDLARIEPGREAWSRRAPSASPLRAWPARSRPVHPARPRQPDTHHDHDRDDGPCRTTPCPIHDPPSPRCRLPVTPPAGQSLLRRPSLDRGTILVRRRHAVKAPR